MIAYNKAMTSKVRVGFWKAIILAAAMFVISLMMITPRAAYADQLNSRSLRIGDPAVGATTDHIFTFSYANTTDSVGSVVFEYCTSPLFEIACVAPPGMDASSATLSQQSGETGYSIIGRQVNKLTLGRAAPSPALSNPSQYSFAGIVNPAGVPDPFYVRITTHASVDGTGPFIDFGAVVNATTQGVHISSEVPPILKFCVGLALGNDCSTANENVIDLGDMSSTRTSSGTSQMIAATNAEFGLAIGVYGTSMTSGNNVIPALTTPTVNAPGNAQFGLNLRDNSDPNVGLEPSGIGIAIPTGQYATPNRYMFESGSTVATSPAATDTRKFTASYIVNVPPNQTPGVYTATLTYVCTATF